MCLGSLHVCQPFKSTMAQMEVLLWLRKSRSRHPTQPGRYYRLPVRGCRPDCLQWRRHSVEEEYTHGRKVPAPRLLRSHYVRLHRESRRSCWKPESSSCTHMEMIDIHHHLYQGTGTFFLYIKISPAVVLQYFICFTRAIIYDHKFFTVYILQHYASPFQMKKQQNG